MVISSLDTASSTSWLKNKPGQTSAQKSATANPSNEATEHQLTTSLAADIKVEEKQQGQQQQDEPEQQLATPPASRAQTVSHRAAEQEAGSPDFTLELSTSNSKAVAGPSQPEATSESRRAKLPYTFNFGIRRPLTLQVAMNRPMLGNTNPATANQAIQQTFDLAATNRLPYEKGSQLNLLA